MTRSEEHRRPWLWLLIPFAVYAAAFLTYAVTLAYAFDESYHLLAAQLVNSGKKPYLDFCFPQTLVNLYINAGWMRLFGSTWRVAHFFAALWTMGAVVLTANYAYRRFPVAEWRVAAAATAGVLVGLNALVFDYASLAQPYGICLFSIVAAFRIAVLAVERGGPWLPALAGLLAGMAAGSSLLTAAAAPVILIWMLVCNRAGSRWTKLIAFGAAGLIPFTPIFYLFALGPKQTWFNVVQYHAIFRKLYWPETTQHDLEVLTAWIDSGQGLVLGLLAIFGLVFIARRAQWPRELKSEFYLSAWLALALAAEVGRAHPTFAQYFLLIAPFLAIPAVAGLYAIASRVLEPDRWRWPVAVVTILFVLGLGKAQYEDLTANKWSTYQHLADKIAEVTPPDALVYADEPVYFLMKRTPPPGLELSYTHRVHLPPADAALFHILSEADVKKLLHTEKFATAYTCEDDDISDYGLKELYAKSVKLEDCTVFWDRK